LGEQGRGPTAKEWGNWGLKRERVISKTEGRTNSDKRKGRVIVIDSNQWEIIKKLIEIKVYNNKGENSRKGR